MSRDFLFTPDGRDHYFGDVAPDVDPDGEDDDPGTDDEEDGDLDFEDEGEDSPAGGD